MFPFLEWYNEVPGTPELVDPPDSFEHERFSTAVLSNGVIQCPVTKSYDTYVLDLRQAADDAFGGGAKHFKDPVLSRRLRVAADWF
ncbi:MAG: hypothetical protein H6736_04115 [Alphaproteobacteria bacterium]|nr:hypothetical protein [Alphaproteobacteria bacterium]MCB9690979.1 hypothetical protein [Alphaproteobacteria bacterium]